MAWSREPGLFPRVPRGPHRGAPWSALGLGDVRVLAQERDVDVRFSAETELRRRGEMGAAPAAGVGQARLL